MVMEGKIVALVEDRENEIKLISYTLGDTDVSLIKKYEWKEDLEQMNSSILSADHNNIDSHDNDNEDNAHNEE